MSTKKLKPLFNKRGEFFVESKIGVKVKILEIGWKLISEIKHQELRGKFASVVDTLKNPDIILVSDQSNEVFLYHKKINDKYLRVVCRHYDSKGFLITAHYIKQIKGGKEYEKA